MIVISALCRTRKDSDAPCLPLGQGNAQFNCMVVSDPASRISWLHKGVVTTDPQTYHFSQDPPMEDPEGRGFIVTGTLSIFGLQPSFTGSVECTASIEFSESITGGENVSQLSILGE